MEVINIPLVLADTIWREGVEPLRIDRRRAGALMAQAFVSVLVDPHGGLGSIPADIKEGVRRLRRQAMEHLDGVLTIRRGHTREDGSLMTAATATPDMLPSPMPRGVNLDDVERGMRDASGIDLTEAKEAIVEALLQLAVQRCTGEGSTGEFIFGVKPSAKLVSGFLLPRFDATGQGDETSDIHLATMGIDLQVAADHTGEITVIPDFVIYARMLPTWEDLVDPRHDIAPRSELSGETRQAVEDRARQYINEAIAALPPIEQQDEPDERPGDAVAEAQRARELADQAEQRIAEEGQSDADALGQNRAAQAAAQRLEGIATARRQSTLERLAARRQRNTAIAAIRREAFSRAFADLGIRLRENRTGTTNVRAVTADDLAVDLGDDKSQSGSPTASAEPRPQDAGADAAIEGTRRKLP